MTITLTREEAQQLLECMETAIKAGDWIVDGACDPDFILYLLRTRLAQPEPEPVDKVGSLYPDFWDWLPKAYGDVGDERAFTKYNMEVAFAAGAEAEAKRMWVGLTDEEIDKIAVKDEHEIISFARAIEAKLKEKNC